MRAVRGHHAGDGPTPCRCLSAAPPAGTLCVGYTTSLGDPTAGGSWSSSNTYIAVVVSHGPGDGHRRRYSRHQAIHCPHRLQHQHTGGHPTRYRLSGGSLQVCAYGDTVHLSDSPGRRRLEQHTGDGHLLGYRHGLCRRYRYGNSPIRRHRDVLPSPPSL